MTVAKYRVKRADEMTEEDYTHNGQIRCQAKSKSSGQRCKSSVVPGAAVCRIHGGSASQVREAGKLRLSKLVNAAIAQLAKEMINAEKSSDRIRASNSILDRAGLPRELGISQESAVDMLFAELATAREELKAVESSREADVIAEIIDQEDTHARN